MQVNPYVSPREAGVEDPSERLRRTVWRLRAVSYFHVAAACACTVFVLVDTGLIPPMPLSPAILRPLFILAMLSWIVCPLGTLLIIARRRPPANIALSGVVVEFSLSAFQFVAMLPLVM